MFLSNLTSSKEEKYLAKVAIFSRVLIWFIAFLSDNLSTHTDFSDEMHFTTSSNQNYHIVSMLFKCLTQWDADYFLSIAEKGYQMHRDHCFFSLFPFLSRWVSYPLRIVLPVKESILLAGVSISHVAFVINCIYFHRLTMTLFKDSNLANKAALMFCFSPASVHYSAMYCDGLFGCLTTIALYQLYKNDDIFDKMAIIKSCFWFGLACWTRANGTFNLFFLGYRLLQILVKILIEERARISRIFWRVLPYIFLAVLAVISCTASYAIHQFYQASIYCWDLVHKYGPGYPVPEYCNTGWWNGYSYLQLEFFGVRPWGYWSWRNLPPIWRNFPIYIIYGLFIINIFYHQSYNTIFMGIPSIMEEEKKAKSYRNNFLKSPKVIPFMWVSLVNMIAIGVNSHVVVSVRLLGQSPLLYWYMAYYTSSGSPGEKGIVPEFSLKRHWMVLYCMWRFIQGGIIFGGEVAWY